MILCANVRSRCTRCHTAALQLYYRGFFTNKNGPLLCISERLIKFLVQLRCVEPSQAE